MKQLPFEWVEEPERDARPEIELPPQTIEAVIALMARALVALVRPSGEAADDR